MSKVVFSVLLVWLLSWCSISLAQKVRILDPYSGAPAVSAHLKFTETASGKSVYVIADEKGEASIPRELNAYPLALQIRYLGASLIQDTFAVAESRTYQLTESAVSMNEVVITGQYEPDIAARSVHSVKVISRKKIDMMAAQNLRDVLSNELNIRLSEDNVLGSSMSIQGISGQNVKIMVDGIPVTGRLDGNIDLSQINLNNIERIEIVEGPLAVNYGTDALAGTVNLITKSNQSGRLFVNGDLYYESNGQYNLSVGAGVQKKNNTFQVHGGRHYFDGWNTGDAPFLYKSTLRADSNRFQSWKPKEQLFGGLNYLRNLGNFTLRLTSDVFDEDVINRGYPRAPYGESAFDDTYRTLRWTNGLHINGKIGTNYRLNLVAGYNHYKRTKNTFIKDLTSLEQNLSTADGDQDTTIFRTFMSRGNLVSVKPEARLNFELGYDLSLETSKGLKIKNGSRQMGDYAVFATAEYKPADQLTIKPGLRAAYNTQYKAPLIPSLHLRYAFPLGGNISKESMTIRASYARGFRAPSLKELYFDFVDLNHNIQGNSDLKAEYSDNFMAGLVWKKIHNQTLFELNWNNFFNRIENRIILAFADNSGTLYSYANIGDHRTMGSSLSGSLALEHFKATVTGGLIGYSSGHDSLSRSAGKFSFTPEFRSNLLYEFKSLGLSLNLFYKYTGEVPAYYQDSDGGIYENVLEDFHTMDFSVVKAFNKGRYSITAGSKNLFNVTALEGNVNTGAHSGGATVSPYSMGRTYFVRLNLNLNY